MKEYADQMHAVGTITVPNPAAAQSVTLGFNPRYVKAINVNNLKMYEWFYGMSAGTRSIPATTRIPRFL